MSSSYPLRIVHVFRAPLGGLFRHVIDLAIEQVARGHAVGLFFDSGGDCARVREAIARIPGSPQLGVGMASIDRNPHPSDLTALRKFARFVRSTRPDVVHGHGSKGGLYARVAGGASAGPRSVRAYTPHGGSFNYRTGTASHAAYMLVERWLARRTEVFLFESDHIRRKYDAFVGVAHGVRRVVVNGLGLAEFAKAEPGPHAADFLYVGELRAAKGVDTLLEALARVADQTGTAPTAVLVGSGPDRDALEALAGRLGVGAAVRFPGPMPATAAFRLGRIMVVPSRAESMPYVVLEGAAAAMPMIATDVGGIPEIFGGFAGQLMKPDDPDDLAARMIAQLRRSENERSADATELANSVKGRFSLENMAETVITAYREALARRDLDARASSRGKASGVDVVSEA